MPYITVTDPETGEERTEWKDQSSLTSEEQGEGFTALDASEDDNFVVGTAKAIPRMFINAGINAVQEGSDTIRDIGGAIGVGEGTTRAEPDKAILGLGAWKPEQLESSGVVEDIATGILQFGLEWVLLSKALKGVSYGLKGSKALANIGSKTKKLEAGAIALAGKSPIAPKTAQTLTKYGSKVLTETSPKAAVIDFAGFDQYEGRLYDLVTEADKWDVIEKIPLLNVLETDPEDEGLQGRAKNALEGFFIDLGIGGVLTGRSALKIRKAKRLAKELAETPKGSAEYKELVPKVIQQGEELAEIPEIKKALTEQQKEARVDRAAFDKGLAHLPPAERDRLWKAQRTKRGLVVEQPAFYHGTSAEAALNINEQGFKSRHGSHGKGVYISTNEEKAGTWAKQRRVSKDTIPYVYKGDIDESQFDLILDGTDVTESTKQARLARAEGKNVLIRNSKTWGTLAIINDDFATKTFKGPDVKFNPESGYSVIKEKRGVPNTPNDKDSILREIEELGPEPPKPAKGKSIVNGKQTDEYKTWNKWNRRKKALDAKLNKLPQEKGSAVDHEYFKSEGVDYDWRWGDEAEPAGWYDFKTGKIVDETIIEKAKKEGKTIRIAGKKGRETMFWEQEADGWINADSGSWPEDAMVEHIMREQDAYSDVTLPGKEGYATDADLLEEQLKNDEFADKLWNQIEQDRALLEEGVNWTGSDWVDADGNPVGPERFKEIEEAQEAFKEQVKTLAGLLERGDLPYFRRKTTKRKKGIDKWGEPVYDYNQEIVRDDEIAAALIEGKSFSEIIDGLRDNNPRGAGLGEGKGISLSHHRGAEQIKEQLRARMNKDGLDIEDVRQIEEFIDMIGESMFDDVAFSIFNKIEAKGRFNFGNKLLEMNRVAMDEGTFPRTMVHELWHTLSRFLPEKDLIAYKKEFKKAQANYLKKTEAKVKELAEKLAPAMDFVEENRPKLNFIQTKVDELLTKKSTGKLTRKEAKQLDALTDAIKLINEFDNDLLEFGKVDMEYKNFKRSIDPTDDFRGGFTEANYRFSEIDEYFAEMLTDQLFLKHWKKADLAPSGTFTRVVQEIGLLFKDLWINLKAQLGGPRTEKIFNDFLKGKNTEKLREYSFDASVDPDNVAAYKENWSDLAASILDSAGTRDAISPDEPLVQMLYRDLRASREKYMPNFGKDNLEDLPEDVLRNVREIVEGRRPLMESAGLWDIEQDVTTLRSPLMPGGKGNRYYSDASEQGSDFEMILNAISKRWDRIELTGMESLSGREIAQELESVFRKDGLNLEQILQDESLIGATELFQRNRENVTNLIKLKFALNFSSEQAAKWATESVNAINNPRIDQTEAIIEMHRYLSTALQFANVYEIWTRSAGQLLQTAQTQINAQGITETLKRQSLSFDKASAIAEASKVPADVVYTNLPPEYLNALETGQWTPRAESFRHQIQTLALDTDTEHGLKTIQDFLGKPDTKEGVKKSKNIDDWEKRGKGLAVYYVNNLLSAAKTWAVQTSGLARAVAEPAFMAATNWNHRIATQQYEYMIRTFYGSLKLGQKAWLTGQSLYDPKIRTGAWAGDIAGQTDMNSTYARNRAYQLDDPHPSYDLNKTPFINELKNNPAHHAANVLWKLGTWNIRGQLAMDTFTKSLAGNSLAYVVGLEEGLTQGAAKGLQGRDLKAYAEQWADAKVEFYTFDAVINGETIANAIMKDETAVQVGRILTFTDEVRAKMPNRTKRYGMELARQRGMTDPAEIEKFANAYRNGELEGAKKLWNRFTRSADGAIQQADNLQDLPGVGEITPTLTSTWSQIPQAWGKLQSARHGYIASFIQPFNRSPGDITKQWVRMIPGLNMTVDTFYRDLFNENAYLRNRWKAEVAVGTVSGGLFAATVLNNDEFPIEFTGHGPNNPQMRKEWTDGERPALSWRTRGRDRDGNPVYGQWHSYRGFEPAATFLAGLSDYKMLYADMSENDRENLVAGFSVSIAAQVMLGRFNSTYYKGIVEFIDAVADVMPITNSGFMKRELEPSERNKLSRYMQRLLTNFIPESSRMRETSRAIDRYKRTVDSSVNPIQSFNEAGEGLVKSRDARGNIIYLEEADANFQDGNPFMNWIAGYWRQQIDEIKNTIPGFSEDLPERINWITGLPIRNAGFLGSDQLPYDDAPWLSRLTGAYFGTLAGTPSEFGIGAKGHLFDPRTAKQKKNGTITKNYMAALVNDEMIKISRAGGTFPPPRPTDFGKGIRLSAPAFRKYKEYIYTVEIGGKTLLETIYSRMKSKSFQRLKYIIHPINDQDGREGFAKADYIKEIINDFKHKAKTHFREDINNEYRMEVILTERQIKAGEELQERQRRGGYLDPIYEQSDNMDLNAQQFSAQLNR